MKLSRRQFIQSAVFAGVASTVGLGFGKVFATISDPPPLVNMTYPFGSQIPEASIDSATGKVMPNPDIMIRHSVCLGCYTDCGNRVKIDRKTGKILRAMGNPYHPISAEPHLPYNTPVENAYLAFSSNHPLSESHGTLCARGNSTVQGPYDPYRILYPLKRAGKRGDGKWKPIAWEDLVEQTVEGGQLFKELGEDGNIEGLRTVRDVVTPLDPSQPALGPKANQLVLMGGRFDGRTNFAQRFILNSYGSANYYGHSGTCGGTRRYANLALLDKWDAFPHLKPDYRSSEFVLSIGTAPGQAGNPMQLMSRQSAMGVSDGRMNLVVVDPVLGGGVTRSYKKSSGWVGIRPGGDGAFVMAMMQVIFKEKRYNREYLECTTKKTALERGYASFTNAAYLVITDATHPNYRKFLRGKDVGLGANDYVVASLNSEEFISHQQGYGQILYKGTVTTTDGKAVAVSSSLQLLKENSDQYSLEEYASEAGIEQDAIRSLAYEFTAHGTKSTTDHHGGLMGSSSFHASYGILLLNALVGSVNAKGGMSMSGGSFQSFAPGPRYNMAAFPGMVKPKGIKISRERTAYEQTPEYEQKKRQGVNPYPATLPWFPLSFESDSQASVSILKGYPYEAKILFFWMQNPLFTTPGLYNESTMKSFTDPGRIPLILSCDVVMGETTSIADYIIPDTHFYESWGAPAMWGGVPNKMTAARWPVVKPLTPEVEGIAMSMESYLIAIGKKMNLPGCGENAIADATGKLYPLHTREDYFLKVLANVAYDGKQSVPDASREEIELMELNKATDFCRNSLTEEEWKKVYYVLARGGRFESYSEAYTGDFLKYQYPNVINIYNEKLGTTRNSLTGQYFNGTAVWLPPVCANGSLLEEKIPSKEWPFQLVSQKSRYRTNSMWANIPVLTDMQKDNPIYINEEDAKALGLTSGSSIKVITPFAEVVSKVKIRAGVAKGTLGISFGFGHWQYGAKKYKVDNNSVGGDEVRGGGIAFNTLSMMDPTMQTFYPLSDEVGGASARNTIKAKVVKV